MNLDKNGDVNADLQHAADPELHRGCSCYEVNRLEYVSACPHGHHLPTRRDRAEHKHALGACKNKSTIDTQKGSREEG